MYLIYIFQIQIHNIITPQNKPHKPQSHTNNTIASKNNNKSNKDSNNSKSSTNKSGIYNIFIRI